MSRESTTELPSTKSYPTDGPAFHISEIVMRLELLSLINRERAARRAVVLVSDLEDHKQRVVLETNVLQDSMAD